jgi:PLP dependent protein
MAARGLTRARDRIAAAAARAGRDPAEVLLVVVSKGRSDAAVREIYDAGQRVFAENRAEALQDRLAADLPGDLVWHFVGTLQRRKVRSVAPHVALLHSMDRQHLEPVWATQPHRAPVLLQVNLAAEPQKHGYEADQVLAAADRLTALGVAVRGLMTLPPAPSTPEDSRPWFTRLVELGSRLRDRHPDAIELSMGMSDDFEVAVECGATMVRLGRTIFEGPND